MPVRSVAGAAAVRLPVIGVISVISVPPGRAGVPYGTAVSSFNDDIVLRPHDAGMRREACALDRMGLDLVRLRERYGWS
ncbi:hypothetical protein AMK11_18085 [Streptomyces sp. CB02414]|nr:hypothetical protein AMK11_18085 [Streptomyces sp. CB02414]